jgi:1,4-dihydroxy-2-naphthoate octaprenyltransferase
MRASTVADGLVRMSRPDHLLLVAAVYLLGATIAVAHGAAAEPGALVGGLCALLPVAASVHYANEYADHETDALTERTPFSGGSGAIPTLDLDPDLAHRAALATVALGTVATAAHLLAGLIGPVAVAVLAGIALFGWQYSVGAALAWRGLGEVDNAALGGLALPVYGYAVLRGTVTVDVVLACLPFFAAVFVNLLATQWPDRQADGTVGKDTLATRWPPRTLRRLYLAGAAVAVGSPPLLALGGVLPWPVAAASVAVAPLLAWGAAWYTRRRSPLPTVAAMVGMAVLQLAAWGHVVGVVPYFASMLQ